MPVELARRVPEGGGAEHARASGGEGVGGDARVGGVGETRDERARGEELRARRRQLGARRRPRRPAPRVGGDEVSK